jgi:predicted small secreted protein
MKNLILFTAFVLTALGLNAQEIFFPTKEGTVLTYQSFDKKDKLSSTVKYTIKHLNIKGSDMDITYQVESIDPKDKLVFKEEITIQQKGDKLYFDMSNFINKAAFQQDGSIPAEIEITGNNLEVPSNPNPGDVLPDASVEMAMKMGFVNMKMSANVTNRKVEAIEDITVAAGTFKGYKFSSEVNSTVMGIKVNSKNTDWYAKGIGIVKSENYDKNGKLQSRTELIEVM